MQRRAALKPRAAFVREMWLITLGHSLRTGSGDFLPILPIIGKELGSPTARWPHHDRQNAAPSEHPRRVLVDPSDARAVMATSLFWWLPNR